MSRTLSEQISGALIQELEDGNYPVGSRFPSESQLALRFHMNKWTVNKAVTRLVEMGMLQRKCRGGGTIVIGRKHPRRIGY